eukprot:1322423-Amorphochlora_amoeboformis.AAC.1
MDMLATQISTPYISLTVRFELDGKDGTIQFPEDPVPPKRKHLELENGDHRKRKRRRERRWVIIWVGGDAE